MKKTTILWILVTLLLSACTSTAAATIEGSSTTGIVEQNTEPAASVALDVTGSDDTASITPNTAISYITLRGGSISVQGSGATVEGQVVTITSGGAYSISGALDEGQIVVDADGVEKVQLILDGVDITCSTSSPILVLNADQTVITLADGVENTLTDGSSYVYEDADTNEPDAALFSKDDLVINGSGSLTVNANYNNGIASKDDLIIASGAITVKAVNDAIKGRDSVLVQDGTIVLNAGGDGIQSNNDEDETKGVVDIQGGALVITAGMDSIQAETSLAVSGGSLILTSGDGSANSSSGDNRSSWGMENNQVANTAGDSAKALKAGTSLTITGGSIQIDSSDDAIHSNGSIAVNGGEILIASGDDGIHADAALEINAGNISITKSYEGIESAHITINDGTIRIASSDDGINTAGGNDGSSINGRPGQNGFEMAGNYPLYVNGGYIAIAAYGDGADINGPIYMSGGVVLINGPVSNGNGPLDYSGECQITGGYLVAVGSSGMAQAPSSTSTQYALMYNFSSVQSAGTVIHIETPDDSEMFTFVPTKDYQSVVFSSPDLQEGATYVIYSGGSSTGIVKDSLVSGGVYTPGTQVASLTISSIVTVSGSMGGGFGRRPGGNMQPPLP